MLLSTSEKFKGCYDINAFIFVSGISSKGIPCPFHHTRIQLEQEVALYGKADLHQTLSISGSMMMLNMILLFVIYPHFLIFF